jgi:threonine dehydratase
MTTIDRLVGLDEIRAARERIAGRVHRTPLLSSATAARFTAEAGGRRLADDRLYLKAEHLQKTGSFKARGMTNRIATLDADQRARGAITMSAGNAGQAYAWAGREADVPVTVVMAAAANPTKVQACRDYGAEVVLEGAHVGEAFAALERIRAERGLTFVHPFEDAAVIAGHGSVGLEILEDLPEVDVVVVGVGGGGLVSGVAAALKEQRPAIRVYGVGPSGAAAMTRAFEAGEPVAIEPATVADGLAAPFAGPLTLAMCRRYLDGLYELDDATILAGVRFALDRMKQVLEPAGAAALAAVLFGRIPLRDGERVAVLASGGNIDTARIGALLAAAAPLLALPRPRRRSRAPSKSSVRASTSISPRLIPFGEQRCTSARCTCSCWVRSL